MVGRIKKIEIGKGKKEGEEYFLTSQEIPKAMLGDRHGFRGWDWILQQGRYEEYLSQTVFWLRRSTAMRVVEQ